MSYSDLYQPRFDLLSGLELFCVAFFLGEQIIIMESINIHLFSEVIVRITVILAWPEMVSEVDTNSHFRFIHPH